MYILSSARVAQQQQHAEDVVVLVLVLLGEGVHTLAVAHAVCCMRMHDKRMRPSGPGLLLSAEDTLCPMQYLPLAVPSVCGTS